MSLQQPSISHEFLGLAATREFVDPLWLPMLVLGVVWIVLWRRKLLDRWMKVIGTVALVSLWLVMTPFGAVMLERPLVVESELKDGWVPEYIYVLSGGYHLGDSPEQDSSGLETVRRVNKGVMMWRRYDDATMVLAGGQPGMGDLREPDQQGLLMKSQAIQLGVPSDKIIIDSVSLNTNGHATVARDSGLHDKDDPLLIVTSDFHLRRARREFSRYFDNVRMVGADPEITDKSLGDLAITSLVPKVDALRDSAIYLREYVAFLLADFRD